MATRDSNQTEGTRTLPDMNEVLDSLPDGRVLGDAAHRVVHRRNLRLERAREASLSRDALRLAAKHGKDASRARTERARALTQAREVRVYRDEVRKAGVATPPVEEAQAALYGRVIDADGTGLARHEVRLEGPRGSSQATRTDRCGRFRIVVGDEVREMDPDRPEERDPQWEEDHAVDVEAENAEAEMEKAAREEPAAEANASGPTDDDAGTWARRKAAEYVSERLDDLKRKRRGGGQTAAARVTVLNPDGDKVAGSRETLVAGQALYREYRVRSKDQPDC